MLSSIIARHAARAMLARLYNIINVDACIYSCDFCASWASIAGLECLCAAYCVRFI